MRMAPSTEECGGRSVRDADRRDTDLLSSRGVRRRVRSPEASRQARERSGDGPLPGAAALWPDAPGRGSPFGARRPCSTTTAARTPSSVGCGTTSTRTSRRRGGYEIAIKAAARTPWAPPPSPDRQCGFRAYLGWTPRTARVEITDHAPRRPRPRGPVGESDYKITPEFLRRPLPLSPRTWAFSVDLCTFLHVKLVQDP